MEFANATYRMLNEYQVHRHGYLQNQIIVMAKQNQLILLFDFVHVKTPKKM